MGFGTVLMSLIISRFFVTHQLYVNTQIYLEIDYRNFNSSIEELTKFLNSVDILQKIQMFHTFKAINCFQLPYLLYLIKSNSLAHGNRLRVFSIHSKKLIDRSGFTMAAPASKMNRLPLNVR